ncbi:MAG TPA: hypothetical protein VIM98_02800 [Dyella sp.]|uniref:hypothetical protein n=1 Tax=Dyella sp. TaxID=1869338 RepID=UPI002F926C44
MIRRLALTAFASLLLAACQTTPERAIPAPSWSSDDGSSMDRAVVITAVNEPEGVNAEGTWAKAHLPGALKKSQALLKGHGRWYDSIDYQLPSGEKKTIYYDISSFFGKL